MCCGWLRCHPWCSRTRLPGLRLCPGTRPGHAHLGPALAHPCGCPLHIGKTVAEFERFYSVYPRMDRFKSFAALCDEMMRSVCIPRPPDGFVALGTSAKEASAPESRLDEWTSSSSPWGVRIRTMFGPRANGRADRARQHSGHESILSQDHAHRRPAECRHSPRGRGGSALPPGASTLRRRGAPAAALKQG